MFGSARSEQLPQPPLVPKDSVSFGAEEGDGPESGLRNLLARNSAVAFFTEQPPHIKARSHPGRSYPQRFPVSDEQVPWGENYPSYDPPRHTEPSVLQNSGPGGWAEGPEPDREAIERRGSHELQARQQVWKYDDLGRPLNPRGRTGIADRGALGKWGANHAGDAVVTRHVFRKAAARGMEVPKDAHEQQQQQQQQQQGEEGESDLVERLEMVAIRRSDTGEWAIPGGMQDPGEVGFQTLVREFREEAGAVSEAEQAEFDTLLKMVFNEDNGSVLYRGYVDDPRNTDHGETSGYHYLTNHGGSSHRLAPPCAALRRLAPPCAALPRLAPPCLALLGLAH